MNKKQKIAYYDFLIEENHNEKQTILLLFATCLIILTIISIFYLWY